MVPGREMGDSDRGDLVAVARSLLLVVDPWRARAWRDRPHDLALEDQRLDPPVGRVERCRDGEPEVIFGCSPDRHRAESAPSRWRARSRTVNRRAPTGGLSSPSGSWRT